MAGGMFSAYFVVSALALVIDWLVLVALTSIAHIEAGAAAVGGYLLGGAANYALSRRFVFRSVATGKRQLGEAGSFAASCVLGAVLTGVIVHACAPVLGSSFSKGLAVSVSLGTLYWIRRLLVFKARP